MPLLAAGLVGVRDAGAVEVGVDRRIDSVGDDVAASSDPIQPGDGRRSQLRGERPLALSAARIESHLFLCNWGAGVPRHRCRRREDFDWWRVGRLDSRRLGAALSPRQRPG